MPTRSTRFDDALRELQADLLRMASFTEQMLGDAVRSLTEQDASLADDVIRRDDTVDDMDMDIEARCMRMLGLHHLGSKDLRIIGTAMKVIADLERIGDYSVDIARTAKVLAGTEYSEPLEDIPRMAELTQGMVRDALTAFVRRDLKLVRKVCDEDEAVDGLWELLMQELVGRMSGDPAVCQQATHLLLVARYLERIADHATNVAERVAYIETGKLEQLAASHKTS
ncbi:MAG: phosphate signaling complex protein PhoU [Armatimonadota bacterium]|jgi:phosphate transport system protein